MVSLSAKLLELGLEALFAPLIVGVLAGIRPSLAALGVATHIGDHRHLNPCG